MDAGKLALPAALAALLVAMPLDHVQAQGRGGVRGHSQAQGRSQSRQQAEQQRGGGAAGQQAAHRESNAARQQIRTKLKDRDVYGREIMTDEERERYRDRVNAASTDSEWARIRQQHQNEMTARARSQGYMLSPPVYGQHMMTAKERKQYTKRLESAKSDAEREQVRTEHMDMMRERAAELGINP